MLLPSTVLLFVCFLPFAFRALNHFSLHARPEGSIKAASTKTLKLQDCEIFATDCNFSFLEFGRNQLQSQGMNLYGNYDAPYIPNSEALNGPVINNFNLYYQPQDLRPEAVYSHHLQQLQVSTNQNIPIHSHLHTIPRQSSTSSTHSLSSNSSYDHHSPLGCASTPSASTLDQEEIARVLPKHVRDKVFNPPSAANPQHYARSARRNRSELNEKRNHRCDYPGKLPKQVVIGYFRTRVNRGSKQ